MSSSVGYKSGFEPVTTYGRNQASREHSHPCRKWRSCTQATTKLGLFELASSAEAFGSLKRAFTMAPILAHVDLTKRFILEADASDFVLGSVLSQTGGEEKAHLGAFHLKLQRSTMRSMIKNFLQLYILFNNSVIF